jgi:hypothetical protein
VPDHGVVAAAIGKAAQSSPQQKAIATPTAAANTSARNEPVPTASRIAGMMMNTDDAGVIDDSVIITLPTTRSDRESSWA